MKFYWFSRKHENDLEALTKQLEENKFSGLLLPYVAGLGDHFVDIARAMKKEQTLKYIVAIRTYTISPQYLAMIIKSLNKIDKNRVWLNFVAGQTNGFEADLGGIIGDVNDSSDRLEKKSYLVNAVPVFHNMYRILSGRPTICISGMTDEVFDVAEQVCDYNIVSYDWFMSPECKPISTPRIISLCPYIIDSEDELNKIKSTLSLPQDVMFVTEQELLDIVKTLKNMGIEKILFSSYQDETRPGPGNIEILPLNNKDKILKFVKYYT